jgi:DNA transposition AAA+ family ATPase
MDALRNEQRTMGESRMIRTLDQVNDSATAAVIEAVKKFIVDKNLSQTYVARAIGISSSTFSEVVGGRYKGDWKQVIFDLDRWLEDEHKRDASPRPTEFVRTKVAEDIMTVAEATATLKMMGLVFGPAGIGKTIALQAVAAEKPGSVFISIETAAASGAGVVDALARAVRANPRARQSSMRHTLEEVKEKLRGTGRLIIIDECHKLCGDSATDERALNIIRDIHDHNGVPILLSGTVDLGAYLDRKQARGKEPMAQIRSRIGVCCDLSERCAADGPQGGGDPLFTIEEIRRVFAKSKMRLAPDAARFLMLLANVPDSGGLRTCRNLVIMATKINQAKAEGLSADMLRQSQRMLVSRRVVSLTEAKLTASEPTRPLMKVG